MTFNIKDKTCIVFDLDDTIYKEIDFLKSAYNVIAKTLESQLGHNILEEMLDLYKKNESTLDVIKAKYPFKESIKDLINIYRFHLPTITPSEGVIDLLSSLKNNNCKIGLITDGRSISQRNKINALNISHFLDDIIISEEFGSEKPSLDNFQYFNNRYLNYSFFYIGDNTKKDFIAPNNLGWTTIGVLDNDCNIHKQDINSPFNQLPHYWIHDFDKLNFVIS
jgi:putative hydrolase of the HAD superfamily